MMPSCAIGVDLGGQSVKLAAVGHDGTIHLRRQSPIDTSRPAGRISDLILAELKAITDQAAAQGLKPAAAAMVMPGYMDRDRSRLLMAANLPTLGGTDFLDSIKKASPLPILFDADSNAATFGEYRFGAGRGVKRLIVAAIGTGIGAGVMIEGEILRIWNHIAGSLGHLIIDARGPKCKCGARGCIEALASGPALERRATELAESNPSSRLAALKTDRGRITGVEIRMALEEDDSVAGQAVEECGWWLGAGIAAWAVIYRPDKVLIGGGIAALGEPLLEAIRKGIAEVGQPDATNGLTIGAAALGADAGVIGAAAMAMPDRKGQ